MSLMFIGQSGGALTMSLLMIAAVSYAETTPSKNAVPVKDEKGFVLPEERVDREKRNAPLKEVNSRLQQWRNEDVKEDEMKRRHLSDGSNKNLSLIKRQTIFQKRETEAEEQKELHASLKRSEKNKR